MRKPARIEKKKTGIEEWIRHPHTHKEKVWCGREQMASISNRLKCLPRCECDVGVPWCRTIVNNNENDENGTHKCHNED